MTGPEVLALFDSYHNMVYRLALSYINRTQDAEDVVQTVFLRALETDQGPQAGKERAWLAQVTVNACRDLLRALGRRRWEPLNETLVYFDRPEERELFSAVMELPAKYRVAVYLHYYEGYTFQEIGKMLKISASAVSMRLHRGRTLLRRYENIEEERHGAAVSRDI